MIAPLPKASKGERPFVLDDADTERLLTMVVALAAEVSTLRDRLDALSDLAGVEVERLDDYRPTPEAAQRRAGERAALIERVFRILYADAERAVNPDRLSYDEIVAMVSGEAEVA